MHDLEVARDLRAASIYLQTRGRLIGRIGRHGGERCVLGALYSIRDPKYGEWTSEVDVHVAALGFEANYLEQLRTPGGEAITQWHDSATFEEVLDRLESTALALELRALANEPAPVEVLA